MSEKTTKTDGVNTLAKVWSNLGRDLHAAYIGVQLDMLPLPSVRNNDTVREYDRMEDGKQHILTLHYHPRSSELASWSYHIDGEDSRPDVYTQAVLLAGLQGIPVAGEPIHIGGTFATEFLRLGEKWMTTWMASHHLALNRKK